MADRENCPSCGMTPPFFEIGIGAHQCKRCAYAWPREGFVDGAQVEPADARYNAEQRHVSSSHASVDAEGNITAHPDPQAKPAGESPFTSDGTDAIRRAVTAELIEDGAIPESINVTFPETTKGGDDDSAD